MSLPRQIKLPAGEIPVRVRMSPRARRLALRIDAQSEAVELVLPRRTSAQRAMAFIEENRTWLDTRITALPPRTVLADGETVPILDRPHVIRRVDQAPDRHRVWIENGEVFVAAAPEQIGRWLIDFLKDLARRCRELSEMTAVPELARELNNIADELDNEAEMALEE